MHKYKQNEKGTGLLVVIIICAVLTIIVIYGLQYVSAHTHTRRAEENYAISSDRNDAGVDLFRGWLEYQDVPPEITLAGDSDAVTYLQGKEIKLSEIFKNAAESKVSDSDFTWIDENGDGTKDLAVLGLPLGVTSTDQCQQYGYNPGCWKRHDYMVISRSLRGDKITEKKQVLVKTFY